MLEAIKGLLASKKFLMAILTVVAWLVARKGYAMDVDETFALISPLIAAIVGQGIADVGKGKALTDAESLRARIAELQSQLAAIETAKKPESGAINLALMQLLVCIAAAFALATSVGCGWLKRESKAVAAAFADCTKGQAKAAVDELAPLADAALSQAIDPDGKVQWGPIVDWSKRFTTNIGGCVLADAVARALAPPSDDPNAPKSSPLVVDRASLRDGFRALAVERFGGVTFKTANGEI